VLVTPDALIPRSRFFIHNMLWITLKIRACGARILLSAVNVGSADGRALGVKFDEPVGRRAAEVPGSPVGLVPGPAVQQRLL
jgi:hypothetical protein